MEKYIISKSLSENEMRQLLHLFYDSLSLSIKKHEKAPIMLVKSDLCFLIFRASREDEIEDAIELVKYANKILNEKYPEVTLSVGISSLQIGEQRILTSMAEAVDALETVIITKGKKAVGYYPKIGGARLIYNISKEKVTRNIVTEVFGNLLKYDADHSSDLTATLEEYVKCNGNISKVGRNMNVHRATIIYRLGKINEITKMDPKEPNNLIAFSLLFKINKASKEEKKGYPSLRTKVFGMDKERQ